MAAQQLLDCDSEEEDLLRYIDCEDRHGEDDSHDEGSNNDDEGEDEDGGVEEGEESDGDLEDNMPLAAVQWIQPPDPLIR